VLLKQKGEDPVHRYMGGGSFGELALMYAVPRASTVRCAVAGSLWSLDRKTFRHAIMSHNKLEVDQTARFLKAVEVLSPLTDEQRAKLAAALEELHFEDGATLWDVGERADWLCLIREGTVVSTSSYREPLSFKVGSFFGTQALKGDPNTKRIAKVVASGSVKAFKLTRQAVNELFGDLSTLIKKNVNMKLIPAIEIFKNLSSTEVEVLVDSAKDTIFKAGETVITKGEAKPSVYIIKEGTAMREKEEITTGACFGEEAFLEKGKQYGSTVVAKENLTCLQIDAHKFGASTTAQMARALEAHNAHRAGSGSKTQRDANKVATMPKKEELTVHNLIGVGSFGRVRLVRHETSSTYYALKCMNKGLVVARKQVTHVNNEKSILARCSHPFLVNLVGWYQDMHELYMLFELMLGGELFSIMSKGIFTADTCRFYSGNVTSAFEYLHERKIAYRDLKPENLLLDEKGYLKIADFGFAKVVKDRTWTLCGTPDYLAPEIITCKGHNCCVDWWALGIFLYELLTGFPPFSADEQVETFKRILSAKLVFPDICDQACRDLLSSLLRVNPTNRLGAGGGREVREHAFYQPLDFVKLISRQLPTPHVPKVSSPSDISNYDKFDEPDLQQWDDHNTDDAKTFGFWEEEKKGLKS